MANAILNQQFPSPSAAWIPGLRQLLPDKTASPSTIDFGAGQALLWARVRIYVKTFGTLAAADTFTAEIITGPASTPVQQIGYQETLIATNATSICLDIFCSAQTAFRYMDITLVASSSHSFTADILVDVC